MSIMKSRPGFYEMLFMSWLFYALYLLLCIIVLGVDYEPTVHFWLVSIAVGVAAPTFIWIEGGRA